MTGVHGASTDQIYAAAGFGAPVQGGGRPAVVVVDLINGFTDPVYPTGSDLDAVVESSDRLLRAAHRAEVPVVHATIEYAQDELDGVAWVRKVPGLRCLLAGSDATPVDRRLTRGDADRAVVKKGASAFFGTDLATALAEQGVDTVVLCGATTSGCIRASAVDAVQSGFAVLVPRQCVGDRAEGPHEANLFDIQAKYGEVVELDDCLSYIASVTR